MTACGLVADVSKEPISSVFRFKKKMSAGSTEMVTPSYHITQFFNTECPDLDLHRRYTLKSPIL